MRVAAKGELINTIVFGWTLEIQLSEESLCPCTRCRPRFRLCLDWDAGVHLCWDSHAAAIILHKYGQRIVQRYSPIKQTKVFCLNNMTGQVQFEIDNDTHACLASKGIVCSQSTMACCLYAENRSAEPAFLRARWHRWSSKRACCSTHSSAGKREIIGIDTLSNFINLCMAFRTAAMVKNRAWNGTDLPFTQLKAFLARLLFKQEPGEITPVSRRRLPPSGATQYL